MYLNVFKTCLCFQLAKQIGVSTLCGNVWPYGWMKIELTMLMLMQWGGEGINEDINEDDDGDDNVLVVTMMWLSILMLMQEM